VQFFTRKKQNQSSDFGNPGSKKSPHTQTQTTTPAGICSHKTDSTLAGIIAEIVAADRGRREGGEMKRLIQFTRVHKNCEFNKTAQKQK
jgi:hypothetical protein